MLLEFLKWLIETYIDREDCYDSLTKSNINVNLKH